MALPLGASSPVTHSASIIVPSGLTVDSMPLPSACIASPTMLLTMTRLFAASHSADSGVLKPPSRQSSAAVAAPVRPKTTKLAVARVQSLGMGFLPFWACTLPNRTSRNPNVAHWHLRRGRDERRMAGRFRARYGCPSRFATPPGAGNPIVRPPHLSDHPARSAVLGEVHARPVEF